MYSDVNYYYQQKIFLTPRQMVGVAIHHHHRLHHWEELLHPVTVCVCVLVDKAGNSRLEKGLANSWIDSVCVSHYVCMTE